MLASGGRASFSGNVWVHDPTHRGGVAYADPGTRAHFDGARVSAVTAAARSGAGRGAAAGVRSGVAGSEAPHGVNPSDARRLEDQARRNGQPQEERYWRDYRAGLDSPDRNRRDYGPDYRGRGDYRYQRDEGYSGDSGYPGGYPDQRDYRYDRR